MWTSGSVSKVIVTKIYVIISSSSHCLVYVLMTVIIKAIIANMLWIVNGFCKLKLHYVLCWSDLFPTAVFVESLSKVSFPPSSLLLMLMVCGRQAPRLVAGSEEVRVVRWGAQFTVGCLGTFPGVYELLAEADNYQSSSGVWLMAPHPATPRSFCLLMSYHKTTPDLESTPADITLVFVYIYLSFHAGSYTKFTKR